VLQYALGKASKSDDSWCCWSQVLQAYRSATTPETRWGEVNRNIREKEVEDKEKQPVSYAKCEIPSPQYNSSSKPNNRWHSYARQQK
jgi:hypothetical protein